MEIYLDNSATTVCSEHVRDVVVKTMMEDYGNPSSMHMKGVEAERYLRQAKEILAKILKVNNRYRYRLTVLCRDRKKPRWLISSLVREFSAGKENKGVFVFADINPLED